MELDKNKIHLEAAMAYETINLEELFEDLLKDLYNAEYQLLKSLPKLMRSARSPDLKNVFKEHLRQTEQHIERIERIFSRLERSPLGKRCFEIQDLIHECNDLLGENMDAEFFDACLTSTAQKVEQYKITNYGTARAWAEELGRKTAAQLLKETLDEEQRVNDKLARVLQSQINREAHTRELIPTRVIG